MIEASIVRLALITMKCVTGQHRIFRFFEYMTGAVILFQQHESLLNCIIGDVLLVTAIIQIKKMIAIPSAARYDK